MYLCLLVIVTPYKQIKELFDTLFSVHHIAISLLFVEKCSDPGKSFLLSYKWFKEQFRCTNGLQAVF